MSITRIISSMVVFGVALFTGFKIGKQVDLNFDIFHPSLDATSMPDVPIPNNDQFNLLLIGVNDIDKPNAQLQSIWLAAFTNSSPQVTLVPIFPSPDDTQQNHLINAAFSLEDGKPSKEFWDMMRARNLWWKGYLINDMSSTIKMITILGDIEDNGELKNGAEIISNIPSWEEDAAMAIEKQKVLLEGICYRLTEVPTMNVETFNAIFLQQPQANVQTTLTINDWAPIETVHENLTCKFPTFTNSPAQSQVVNSAP